MSTIDVIDPNDLCADCEPMTGARTGRRTWSLRTSFWIVVSAQVLLLAASNFPTPLFPLYAQRYGFGSGVITSLFGVYVLVLIPTLLLIGRVADRVGRRPLLVAGIAVTALSSLAFAVAHSVVGLFAGEIVYGVGGGLVMSSAAVTIRELHPRQDVAAGALAGTLANAVGLTLGPLVSGFLATVTPWPTVSPYLLDIVLAGLLAAALLRIPETHPERPSADAPAPLRIPETHPEPPSTDSPAPLRIPETHPEPPTADSPAPLRIPETHPEPPTADSPTPLRIPETHPEPPSTDAPAPLRIPETHPEPPSTDAPAPLRIPETHPEPPSTDAPAPLRIPKTHPERPSADAPTPLRIPETSSERAVLDAGGHHRRSESVPGRAAPGGADRRATQARRAPLFQVPAEIRSPFVAAAVAGAAGWMALGWVFGLSPSFLHVELGVHITQPIVAGLFAALVVVSNGTGQVLFRHHTSVRTLRVGLAAIVGGMALVFGSMIPGTLAVALVGAVIAGGGAGVVQMHTMATIQRIVPAHLRGGVTSAFFTTGYVAMSVPVVVAGFIADKVGLGAVTVGFLVVLTALVGTGLALTRRTIPAGGESMELEAEVVPDIGGLEELGEALADA